MQDFMLAQARTFGYETLTLLYSLFNQSFQGVNQSVHGVMLPRCHDAEHPAVFDCWIQDQPELARCSAAVQPADADL
jgi:hypothetical protein